MARRPLVREGWKHRKPWVHSQPSQSDQRIYVVEILKLNGRWYPFRAPTGPDFGERAAKALIQEMRKESRLLNAAWKEGRFRVMPYQQVILVWPDKHTEE